MTRALWSRRFAAAVATVTAASIVAVLAPTPALATTLGALENRSTLVQAATPGFAAVTDALPLVDSLVGRGTELTTDPAGTVRFADAAARHSGVLARLTLLEPTADTTVSTGGTAVLHGRAGTTTSTTVLLPLSAGTAPLHADRAAPVRVEPLAFFDGTEAAPGATLALDEPVVRADTAAGLGGTALTSAPLWVGLTGAGDVSSTAARAVHVTLDLTLDRADRVAVGTQRLSLPAGRSIVTTVVDTDAQGGTTLSLATPGNTASVVATVLGWVAQLGEDHTRANATGGYVVNTEATAPTAARLAAGDAPRRVTVADHDDVDWALVLVQADAVTGGDTTTLSWGERMQGRATGTAVDRAAGTAPQLTLVRAVDADALLSIRRGAARVTVQPLGGFLGAPAAHDPDAPVTIAITAPHDLASIDLTEQGYFTLEGTVDAGANAIDRIEISSPAVGFIGTAEIDAVGDELTWSFRALAPEDGEFDYIAEVFDRAHPDTARDRDEVRLVLDVAEEGDTVVSPDARVFHLPGDPTAFHVLDERRLAFAERPDIEPGDIIVSGPLASAPSGFLGRMSHMDLVDGEWIVETVVAGIDELFLQVDIAHDEDFGDGEDIQVIDLLAEADDPADHIEAGFAPVSAEGTTGPEVPLGEVEVDGEEIVDVRSGHDVDLALSADEFPLDDPADFALACRMPGDGQEPVGEEIDDEGRWEPAPGAAPSPDTSCGGPLQAGVDLTASWTMGLDFGITVVFDGQKVKVKTADVKDPQKFEAWAERELESAVGIAAKVNAEVNVGLTFALDVKMTFKWKVIPKGIKINEFTLKLTSKVKAGAALSAFIETTARINAGLTVAEVILPTISFMVGPVPVVITNQLNLAVALEGELKATVKLPVGVERKDVFGFTYSSDGGMERLKTDEPTKYVVPTFGAAKKGLQLTLGGAIAAGPEASYQSRIYSFAGPDLVWSAKAGIDGEITVNPLTWDEFEYEANVFLEYALTGKAKLTLIRWTLLNLNIFTLKSHITLVHLEGTIS